MAPILKNLITRLKKNRAKDGMQPEDSSSKERLAATHSGRISRLHVWCRHFSETSHYQHYSTRIDFNNIKSKHAKFGYLVKPHYDDNESMIERLSEVNFYQEPYFCEDLIEKDWYMCISTEKVEKFDNTDEHNLCYEAIDWCTF